MNRILELREKRAKAWDAAKKFLDAKTGPDGLVSAEDSATYDKMEADVLAMGKEVERLERQAAIDAALNAPANQPITEKPAETRMGSGKGSPEYWVAVVKPGRVMFEISGVTEEVAREAMRLAANKLPIKCKFVVKAEQDAAGSEETGGEQA